MHLTEMSFVLLPICLLCAFMPDKLLLLVRYFGVMGGGAILVVGGFGVPTTMVPTALFIGNFFLQILLGRRFNGQGNVLRLIAPFVVLTVYAIATAFVLPNVFDSAILVSPQRWEPGVGGSLLHFGMGNITQSSYLAIACIFCTCSALFMAGRAGELIKQFNAFLASGFCIVGIAFWQLANKVFGIPFPDDFFHSNPGWAELSDQAFGAAPRINGPFTEPSALGGATASFAFCAGWLLLQGHRHRGLRLLMVLSVICVIMSTSTAGLATVAAGIVFVAIYSLSGVTPAVTRRLLAATLPLGCVAVLAILLLPVFAPNVTAAVGEITSATLEKQQTLSYEDRTSKDADSYAMVADTYGLGVGFGSNRPSSLIASMISQIGLPGLAILVIFVYSLTRYARRARRLAGTAEQKMVIQGMGASLVGSLGYATLAGPNISNPDFYLSVGLFVAAIATIELGAHGARNGDWATSSMHTGNEAQPIAVGDQGNVLGTAD